MLKKLHSYSWGDKTSLSTDRCSSSFQFMIGLSPCVPCTVSELVLHLMVTSVWSVQDVAKSVLRWQKETTAAVMITNKRLTDLYNLQHHFRFRWVMNNSDPLWIRENPKAKTIQVDVNLTAWVCSSLNFYLSVCSPVWAGWPYPAAGQEQVHSAGPARPTRGGVHADIWLHLSICRSSWPLTLILNVTHSFFFNFYW